jgi:hypothetical protein
VVRGDGEARADQIARSKATPCVCASTYFVCSGTNILPRVFRS